RGTLEVTRATASGPGVDVDGSFRWREGGEVGGRISIGAKDLGAALANAGGLLGKRLPAFRGRARVDATLGGTSAAPTVVADIDAPAFRAGEVGLADSRLSASYSGPAARPSVRVEGRIAAVRGGTGDVARGVVLRGSLAEDVASVTATASLPGFRDPASLDARGRLGASRETLALSELAFAYPGSRWGLSAPATIGLAGPRVDRLEIASGAQRIAISGGLVRGRILDARLELVQVDLARLPAGLLPASHVFRGELTGDATATGTAARPEIAATFSVGGGAVDEVDGLSLVGSARWSGPERRLKAALGLSRAAGGTVDVDADVPLPSAGRPAERVLLRARAREVPIEEVLAAAATDVPAAGLFGLDAVIEGTAGAPSLSVGATVTEGEWRDLDALALQIAAEDPGEKLRLSVRAGFDEKTVVALDAEVPLDLSDLLDRPAAALRAVRTAPLEGSLAVTGLDLGTLSGRAGVPPRIAGVVDAAGSLSGAIAAPRAKGSVDVRGGAWGGYRDLSGRADVTLADAAVSVKGRLAMAGDEAARFDASIGAPVEKLGSEQVLRAAPLRADVTVPRLALARAASPDVPLTGTVNGRITAAGTLRAPEATVALAGEGVAIEGRPLGNARLDARYGGART
ncbi:MAG TPA: translocation/assembly module TamB, partial [Anaeromyxobacter sp.]